jgi:Kef-type K+ transport system membrane component KefB
MDWGVAAIWLGLAVLVTLISVGLRLSVALTEILVGVAAGAFLGKDLLQTNASWVAFVAGVGSVLLTFLAGAELDPETLRRSWKEALGIGLAGFFAPFSGASFLADSTYEGGRGISGAFLGTLGATSLLVGVVSGRRPQRSLASVHKPTSSSPGAPSRATSRRPGFTARTLARASPAVAALSSRGSGWAGWARPRA